MPDADAGRPGHAAPRNRGAAPRATWKLLATATFQAACCAAALLTVSPGCGEGRPRPVPVSGRVVFASGQPVVGGQVEFEHEDGGHNARGAIGEDGAFRLTTFDPGDGAVPGRHRVIVQQPLPFAGVAPDHLHQHARPGPRVARRHGDYATSQLAHTIGPEGTSELVIVVKAEGER